MSTLVSSSRPPLHILILTWLFFVAIPAALIWSLWHRVIAWEENRQSETRRHRLEQEMQAFSRELETPALIELTCSPLINAIWKNDFQSGRRLTAGEPGAIARLCARLERALPFSPAAMIWHGPDTDECWYHADRNWDSTFSRRGLLQIMALTNGQVLRRRVTSTQAPEWLQQMGRLTDTQRHNQSRSLSSTLFGDIVRVRFEPWQAVPFLSRGSGGGGRLFAFYAMFPADDTPTAPLLGGCLLLFRERDMNPDRLLQFVTRRPLQRGLERDVVTISPSPATATGSQAIIAFRSDSSGDHLEVRPGEWFLALLAGRGTFQAQPGNSQRALKVTFPDRQRRSPLRALLPYLATILQIGFSLGSLLFVHLGFFGFTFPLRLRGKILIGTLLATVFPVSLLTLGLVLQHRLQIDRTRAMLVSRLQSQQSLIERRFRAYLADLRLSLLSRTADVRSVAETAAPFAGAFAHAFRGLPIQDIFAVSADRIPFRWTDSSNPDLDTTEMECTALLKLAEAFQLGADPATRHKRPEVKVHGIIMNLTGIGDFLARPGYLLSSDLLAGKEMTVSGIPLSLASGAAALIIRFRPEDLVTDFFRTHGTELDAAQEKIGDWQISLAALKLSLGNTRRIAGQYWEPYPHAWKGLQPHLERAIRLGLNIDGTTVSGKASSRLITTTIIPRFPCLLVAWADSDRESTLWPLLAGALLYVFALVGFIVLLLEQVFRHPILFFTHAATEIEQGRYPSQPPVIGGDELGRLGQAFGDMVQGLRQRDELSHFVSDEVMTAVQSDSDDALKPGGELMPVTILFASLRGFRTRAPHLSPSERLRLLNAFLDNSVQVLKMHGGSLDKMIEDTVMGVFRPRENTGTSSVRAVQAALQLQKALFSIWEQEGLSCDIGIAHGTVLSGRIGSHHGTLDFSVIGNAVNLAARLKAEAKKAKVTGILLDPNLISHARGTIRVAFLERVSIKGRSRSFNLYEAISIRENSENKD